MPVAQHPSHQHQHQQHHHLFSAIGTFLHARHPSSDHNNPNSSSSVVVPVSDSIASHGAAELAHLYQAFESQLAQRLTSLLPAEKTPSVSLASLKQFMGFLLAAQKDLRDLIPAHHTQTRAMEEFLDRSVKLLDVCRDIKEQMTEVRSLQGMLQVVIFCLSSEQGDSKSGKNLIRARKALALLLLHMGIEREDDTVHVDCHRSFRGRIRERLGRHGSSRDHLLHSPQRWRSWPGNHGPASSSLNANNVPVPHVNHALLHTHHASMSSWHGSHAAGGVAAAHAGGNPGSHASELFKTLHALELNLFPPKLPAKDEEECFCAAVYALNVLSVFILGTITAAFPSFGRIYSGGFIQVPHNIAWAAPFSCLQEKVQEELRGRSKTPGAYAGMWELDQISFLVKRLLEFASLDEFPGSGDNKEEVKKLVKQFHQHVQELEMDMGALHAQINEFYDRIITARMEILDLLSIVNA